MTIPAYGSESLNRADFVGQWQILVGDFASGLVVHEDFSGEFFGNSKGRRFSKFPFEADGVVFHDDLMIIDVFMTKPRGLIRRFTLSGWKSGDTTMIYGYMYLYDGFGRQFNGMEVTLEKIELAPE